MTTVRIPWSFISLNMGYRISGGGVVYDDGRLFSPFVYATVPMRPVGIPDFESKVCKKEETEVFPFVPVTAISRKSFVGSFS